MDHVEACQATGDFDKPFSIRGIYKDLRRAVAVCEAAAIYSGRQDLDLPEMPVLGRVRGDRGHLARTRLALLPVDRRDAEPEIGVAAAPQYRLEAPEATEDVG